MFDLSEEIRTRRKAIADNIAKAFQVDPGASYFEKARNVGDIHPNGKWVWKEYKPGKFDWRVAKKEDKQKDKTSTSIKVGNIFDDIKAINPNVSEISSIGSFTSEQDRQVAESVRVKILKYLPDNSLASKILKTSNKLSDKQLWVVAYELQKNEDYVSDLSERNEKLKREVAYQKKKRSDKRRKRAEEARRVEEANKETSEKNSELSVGDKVKHVRIGAGTITEITSDKITIKFDDGDVKSFMPDFVKLEKI